MGVPGLWQYLEPAKKRISLTEFAVAEGFVRNGKGTRSVRVGIDASIWIADTQAVFSHPGLHARAGPHPELRAIYYRLARLLRLPIVAIFVFDGIRPVIKRGKEVKSTPHWMTQEFQKLIEGFGFYSHIAPGEAEAELAKLDTMNIIDIIMTKDGDAFMFGATHVIYGMTSEKVDKDDVSVYSLDRVQSLAHLTQSGIFLMAVLSGGDYDKVGLRGCGERIAYQLAQSDLGDALYQAATSLSTLELSNFLVRWRDDLRTELATDWHGYLGRKYPALAKAVPESFPNPKILCLYANPVTSWSGKGHGPDLSHCTWRLPDLAELVSLCERLFSWEMPTGILANFQKHIWPGICIRRLIEPNLLMSGLMAHHMGAVNDTPFSLASVSRILSTKAGPPPTKAISGYHVEVLTDSLLTATLASTSGQHARTQLMFGNVPLKIVVWIPCAILKQVMPLLVQQFVQQQKQTSHRWVDLDFDYDMMGSDNNDSPNCDPAPAHTSGSLDSFVHAQPIEVIDPDIIDLTKD